MHILRVADIPNNRTGGMSRTMYGTEELLSAKGHTIDYLFADDLQIGGRSSLRRFSVPARLPRLVKHFARHGKVYDVIEIHEPLAAPYCFQYAIGKDLPPPVLFSYGLEERGHQAELVYRKMKHLPVSLKRRYSPLSVIWQAMYGVRHARHVICSNASDVQYLCQAGISPKRLTQHRSGVTLDFIQAGEQLSQQNVVRNGILFVGSWLLRKGILDMTSAVTQVLQENSTLRFTVAGCGGEARTIQANFPSELHPRIRVIPQVSTNAELRKLYRENAIFLLPSYFEGQPLVMIEAAAMGMAIVTTNICGMVDFIEHNENGLLVSVGDTEAIADSLRQLITHPEMAQSLGESARQTAQKYTWENAAYRIEAAYAQAAGQDSVTEVSRVQRMSDAN